MPVKALLNAVHDVVKWTLHVICVPAVAILKALASGIDHLIIEIEKL